MWAILFQYKGEIMNLLEELDEAIASTGHAPDNIKWMTLSYGCYKTPENIELKPIEGIKAYSDAYDLYKGIEYDSGYGTQYLHGLVVFYDNSWLERAEYDGSEWWEYHKVPQIEDYIGEE